MYYVNVYYLALLSLCFCGTGSYGRKVCSSCQCPYVSGENLDCSGRSITSITECEPLYGCLDVTTMNFSSNAITEVYLSLFPYSEDCRSITCEFCHLDFSRNEISKGTISFEITSCQSFTLDFSFNAFRNIAALEMDVRSYGSDPLNSVTLNISRNQIVSIESIRLPYWLRNDIDNFTVDLSFNEIKHGDFQIDTISYIRRVNILLNDNNITHFEINYSLRNPERIIDVTFIDLSNNYISHFTEDDLSADQFNRDIRLDLSGNRWNCNCSQRPISEANSSLRNVLIKEGSGQPICANPPSVRGRPILSLSAEEFVCSPEIDRNASLQHETFQGDTVEMMCPFVGGDPPVERVDWEFGPGDPQESGEKSSIRFQSTCINCPLVIKNVQKGAEGDYRCTVSNGESLTIRQTLRLFKRKETMDSSTAVQTGLVAAVMGILWMLTMISLIVLGYRFYRLRREGASTDVVVRYRSDLPNVPQCFVQSSRQGNGGYDKEDDGLYEVPRAARKTSEPTDEVKDLYEEI